LSGKTFVYIAICWKICNLLCLKTHKYPFICLTPPIFDGRGEAYKKIKFDSDYKSILFIKQIPYPVTLNLIKTNQSAGKKKSSETRCDISTFLNFIKNLKIRLVKQALFLIVIKYKCEAAMGRIFKKGLEKIINKIIKKHCIFQELTNFAILTTQNCFFFLTKIVQHLLFMLISMFSTFSICIDSPIYFLSKKNFIFIQEKKKEEEEIEDAK
jgi:hypothetical protein